VKAIADLPGLADIQKLGTLLRTEREKRGVPLSVAALWAGTNPKNLVALESGACRRMPGPRLTASLASLYNLRVTDLMKEAGYHFFDFEGVSSDH